MKHTRAILVILAVTLGVTAAPASQTPAYDLLIRGGQVLCQGSPAIVLANPKARKYYFGEGFGLGAA